MDPDPNRREKPDPNPDPHQCEKSDPDPHQSEQQDADPHQRGSGTLSQRFTLEPVWRPLAVLQLLGRTGFALKCH